MVDTMMVDGETKAAAEEAPARVSRAELEARVERLNRALVEATESRNRLTAEVMDAQAERNRHEAAFARLGTEFQEFKDLVVKVAVEEAERREWCDEIKDVLDRLGLEWPDRRYQTEVTITLTMSATREAGLPTESWVQESVHFDTSYTNNGYALLVGLDDDNDEVCIDDYSVVSVGSVEAVE